ncbi:DUF1800 domain-containing protein [Thalassotalea crassostreae]|uniref:DUF1800 domain-containing protein n=1 Tax=Thalassotalea crassostreae TaxID=1763536 RepID=UPI0009EDE251|nr:DUF1800 family protein [Thalassotalea crassostreae]
MSTTTSIEKAAIAANRFGLGARGNELSQAQSDPKTWLINQLQPIKFSADLPSSGELMSGFYDIKQQERMLKKSNENEEKSDEIKAINKMRGKHIKNAYSTAVTDTFVQALNSSNSLSWRLLDFYSNHFSVTTQGAAMGILAATLEREAIAPHIHGSFENLLLAVTSHPAMLMYLNNERSFGANSRFGKKKGAGLNENLAREILELHTLGVDGGYQQQDVIELAKGITGWSIGTEKKDGANGFKFRHFGKEPGTRVLLGKVYKQKGIKQGIAMLQDLANHPNTANHVCSKLVKHFISDKPNEKLVAAMVETWKKTGGNLKQVAITMINNDLAWQPEMAKYKTPREYLMSSLRALNFKKVDSKKLIFTLTSLGQQPFKAGSPKGYSDEQQDWDGSNALISRIDWTSMLAQQVRNANAENIMNRTLALNTGAHTYKSVIRAESRTQALMLFFMSPEFLRR